MCGRAQMEDCLLRTVFCLLDMLKFWQKGPLMLLLSVNLGTLEVFGEGPDVSIIPSCRSVVSLVRVNQGDTTNSSRYYKLTIERLDKEFWQKHFQKWYQFTIRRAATVKCE